MTRALLLVGLLGLLPIGAGAAGPTYFNGPMPLLGAPARTPAAKPGFTPAPMPNQDVILPRAKPPVPGEPEFSAELNNTQTQVRSGAGFAPGSTFSDELQRKNRTGLATGMAPSFAIKVPLDK